MSNLEPLSNNPPAFFRGTLLVYRVFDIAEEIDLTKVETILRNVPVRTRFKLTRAPGHSLTMRNAPLRFKLGETEVRLDYNTEEKLKFDIFITLFDYGVLSLCFQTPLDPSTNWKRLLTYSDTLMGNPKCSDEFDSIARQKAKDLTALLKSSLKVPAERTLFEDYVIYFFEEIEGIQRAQDLLTKMDISALLLGEKGEGKESLSARTRDNILENQFQYAENDMVVIDWNSAFVLEPSGQRDVADILEFALTHLLEFRYYDDVLDQRLAELYDRIESQRSRGFGRALGMIFNEDFASISRSANARFIEFSELIERIDNSLKVVGDFYLANIFRGGVRRFRIPDWQQSVVRKTNVLARVSELLQGEINVQRGMLLEFIIIALIAFEIISAIFGSIKK